MKRLFAGSAALVATVGVGVGLLAAPSSHAQASAVVTSTKASTAVAPAFKHTPRPWEIKKPAVAGVYGSGTVHFDGKNNNKKIPVRVDFTTGNVTKTHRLDVTYIQTSAFSGKNKTGKKIGYEEQVLRSDVPSGSAAALLTSKKNVAKSVEIFFFTKHFDNSRRGYRYISQSVVVNK